MGDDIKKAKSARDSQKGWVTRKKDQLEVLNANKAVQFDVLEDAVSQFDKAFEKLELAQESYEVLIDDATQQEADIAAMHDFISKARAPRIVAGSTIKRLMGDEASSMASSSGLETCSVS